MSHAVHHGVARSRGRPPTTWPRRLMWLAVLALSLGACVVGSPYMRAARAPEPLRPAEGYAMVVFVQPSALAVDRHLTILDGQGRFLGDSLAQTYFAVQVPPGEQLFIGRADEVTAVRATVAAAETTYVLVAVLPRSAGTEPVDEGPVDYELRLLTKADDEWAGLAQWLVECTQLVADESAGQRFLRRHEEEVTGWIRQGEQHADEREGALVAAQNSPSQ